MNAEVPTPASRTLYRRSHSIGHMGDIMKFLIALLVLSVGLGGCSRSSELHDAMEDMKDSYKLMNDSGDLNGIRTALPDFSEALTRAREQKVAEQDQAVFDKGMDEMAALMTELDTTISGGELAEVRIVLKKLGDVRKEYHEKLEVK